MISFNEGLLIDARIRTLTMDEFLCLCAIMVVSRTEECKKTISAIDLDYLQKKFCFTEESVVNSVIKAVDFGLFFQVDSDTWIVDNKHISFLAEE